MPCDDSIVFAAEAGWFHCTVAVNKLTMFELFLLALLLRPTFVISNFVTSTVYAGGINFVVDAYNFDYIKCLRDIIQYYV